MLSRNLKLLMHGDDVGEVKKELYVRGYLTKYSHDLFGYDTLRAVKAFQSANGLEADGIVGPLTYAAMFEEPSVTDSTYYLIPDSFPEETRRAIANELDTVSKTRQAICIHALEYAVDPAKHPDMKCFYVRGGNLFNTDLSENKMTEAKLKKYFSKSAYAPYYDNGRKEVMTKMAEASGYTIPGADCSGFIVGLWRYAKVVKSTFDATANSLYNSYCVPVNEPKPGDLAWKSGHIGIYVGGNLCVECAGGEYGVQVSGKKTRYIYSYTLKKKRNLSPWKAFGDPKVY